tara:strand:+ start:846 stop:1043 length:198 start_codon:yes stop_codon:yes gene_type:complete
MTNRLARGSPDRVFTQTSGPGMVVEITHQQDSPFKPRYRVKWLKSGVEMVFHPEYLIPVKARPNA